MAVAKSNIFFNDFAGSGRTSGNDTSGFVVVNDSNADDDSVVRNMDAIIERNIFLNWDGQDNYGFLQIGEDGQSFFEPVVIVDLTVGSKCGAQMVEQVCNHHKNDRLIGVEHNIGNRGGILKVV